MLKIQLKFNVAFFLITHFNMIFVLYLQSLEKQLVQAFSEAPIMPPPRSVPNGVPARPPPRSGASEAPTIPPPKSGSREDKPIPLPRSESIDTPTIPPPRPGSREDKPIPLPRSESIDAPTIPPPRPGSREDKPIPLPQSESIEAPDNEDLQETGDSDNENSITVSEGETKTPAVKRTTITTSTLDSTVVICKEADEIKAAGIGAQGGVISKYEAVQWFKIRESQKIRSTKTGKMADWFHGIISRT